jgi:nitrogen fixation NifU-like protein
MNGLDSLYQELILEHSKRPIGQGPLENAEGAQVFEHHEYNPSCGDEITLRVAVNPDTKVIEQLAWEGQGCSISTASASMLSQLVRDEKWDLNTAHNRIDLFRELLRSQGSGVEDMEVLGDAVAFQGVGKFVMRVKCAMLAWVALEVDLKQFASA